MDADYVVAVWHDSGVRGRYVYHLAALIAGTVALLMCVVIRRRRKSA